MGKQRTQELIRAGQDTIGMGPDKVVEVFTEHYELAKRRMLPEAAIATAAAAAQNLVASIQQQVEQGREDAKRAERQGGGGM